MHLQAPTKPGVEPTALVSCAFTPFQLRLIGSDAFIILLTSRRSSSRARARKEARRQRGLPREQDGIEFAGPLSFVNTLKDIIPFDGFSDPPYLDVDGRRHQSRLRPRAPDHRGRRVQPRQRLARRRRAGAVPRRVARRHVQLLHQGEPVPAHRLGCSAGAVSSRSRSRPRKCRVLEAAFEFGACVALDFGVASGSDRGAWPACTSGSRGDGDATLTGYFRLRGEVEVLGGLISASDRAVPRADVRVLVRQGGSAGATLTIEVEVFFLSFSVEISCEKKFKGSNNDPSFVEIMGPAATGRRGVAVGRVLPCVRGMRGARRREMRATRRQPHCWQNGRGKRRPAWPGERSIKGTYR